MRCIKQFGVLVGALSALGFASSATAPAAAVEGYPSALAGPAAILFHGPGLDAPVVLPVRVENITVLGATTPIVGDARPAVAGRPAIAMALFWSPRWNEIVAREDAVLTLDPADAEQHGVYYPAPEGRPALLSFGPDPLAPVVRVVDAPSRALLEKYGLP